MGDSRPGQTAVADQDAAPRRDGSLPGGGYRIAFVSSHARHGGSERYLSTLLGTLGPKWTKSVVVLEEGPFVEELRSEGRHPKVVPTSARPWGILASAWRLRRLLVRNRPDLVHANGIKAALVSVIATAGRSIPVVWIKHDVSWDGWLSRIVGARCAAIVAVSAFVMRSLPASVQRKVRVIYNGIDPVGPDRLQGRERLLEAIGASEPIRPVCLVGRLDPSKGHEELLAAAARLRDRLPQLRIVFIGGEDPVYPGYESTLRERTRGLGVDDIVHFLGYRDDAYALIAGCDALVIASFANERGLGREAFAFVGLEALSAGTAVVAYEDGGIPELLEDCGVLIPPGDREGLARELASLLDDGERRRHLAECGQERVRTKLSLEGNVAALISVYDQVVQKT